MKKAFIVIIVMSLFLAGCATPPPQQVQSTETLNRWLEFSIAPSRIVYNGDIIMRSTPRADGASLWVYFDPVLIADAYFYHITLMHDFGWRRNNEGTWTATRSNAHRLQEGVMYVNPSRRVAIYIFPVRQTFDVFRVRIVHD